MLRTVCVTVETVNKFTLLGILVKLVWNVISTLQCIFDRSRKFRRGGKFEKTWRMSEDGRMASDGRRITIGRNAESNGPMISRYP